MTEEDDCEVIELNQKTDLLSIHAECPFCGAKHHGVPYVHIPCSSCGSVYRTDFNQDIYTKKAKQIASAISYKDKIKIRAVENYENEVTTARQHFIKQGCWTVSGIVRSMEEHRKCFDCGICLNCLTCKGCGKAFTRDKNKRKQICPTCKSSQFVKTRINKILINEKNRDIMLCPHCKSDNIRLTRTTNKTKCHLCGSKNLSEKKIDIIFEFTVERKEAYKIKNLPKS